MDIHKPKAAHSWREFLIEIGTIICGILIALGLEQAVDAIHWTAEVHEARVALQAEMTNDNKFFALRAATRGCLEARLGEIEAIVENVAAGRRERPVKTVELVATQRLEDNVWLAERSSQTVTHFSSTDLRALSRYYQQIANTREWLHEEHISWAKLAVLEGDPNRLAGPDIAQLRTELRFARDRNRYIAIAMPDSDSDRFGARRPAADQKLVRQACAPLQR